jgi:hypothetical protein
MARKSALEKLQETVVDTVRGVAKDPVGTAKGTIALGRMAAGEVVGRVSRIVRDRVGGTPSAPPTPAPAHDREPDGPVEVTPADVARVVEKKPPAKKAPAKKTAAKTATAKSTPSGKLPAKKAAAKKAPAKKSPAKKSPAKKTAAEDAETGAQAADPEKD